MVKGERIFRYLRDTTCYDERTQDLEPAMCSILNFATYKFYNLMLLICSTKVI
jgi:hypothetical protein